MSEVDIAWAAGFIDGEGYVIFGQNSPGYKTLKLDTAQIDRSPLDKLSELFGGNVTGPLKPASWKKHPKWSPFYKWRIHGEKARKALIQMLPYLTVKLNATRQALADHDEYKKKMNE